MVSLRASSLAVLMLAAFLPSARAEEPPALESAAVALYTALSPEQRTKAVLPFDSPDRGEMQYTGGTRAGIPLRDLQPAQRELALKLVTLFTSDAGAKKAAQVAAQDKDGGWDKYYLAFFGEPAPGKTYAWRVAEHHLTLVHVEVESGKPASFGPILLGSNPPDFWGEEEDAMIALYAALTPEERKKAGYEGRAIASSPIGDAGVKVSDLGPAAQEKAKAVFENRLSFFAPAVAARIRSIAEKQGGLGAMRIAFWGEAVKRCAAGGMWDFKLGGPTFLCDYENTRKHIHMSMRGSLKE